MGNQSGNVLSQAEIGRRPSDREMMVLLQLQRKLFTRLVESPEHLTLLMRYWDSHFVNKHRAPAFERRSAFWCTEGGFTSENPGDDLRSMGELGLQCLVYFAEQYPGEARMMKRAKGGYPFVKAAMAVARSLCEALHLVDETGTPGKFPVIDTLYWQLLEQEEGFYKLFALCFLLFEQLYCEEIARDRSLPVTQQISTSVVAELVDATKTKLLAALQRAPLQLEDLSSLCLNADRILQQRNASEPASQKTNSIRAPTRASSMPSLDRAEADRMASWRQHHTDRKSMRAAAKSWSAKLTIPEDEPLTGVAPRLVPRPPEIAFKREPSAPPPPMDLFEGLTTKSTTGTVTPTSPPRPAAAEAAS